MSEKTSEGIILRTIPLTDTKRILTAFLPLEGVISLSARALSPALSRLAAATTPFARSELVYRKGRGEIYKLIEASLLEDHLALRDSSEHLHCAAEILKLLLRTQLPGKPSPQLYDLTKAFLARIQNSPSPQSLLASFLLKFLKAEGLFLWTQQRPPGFNFEEWSLVEVLAGSRSFQEIESKQVDLGLAEKIRDRLVVLS